MSTTYFSDEHEWITVNGNAGFVGITNYAQEQLGDVVYVEVSKVGQDVVKGDDVGVVESVKAASDVYSPVSGTITQANEALDTDPGTVNSGAESNGWMFEITLSDLSELDGLMDSKTYKSFTEIS